MSEKKRVAVVIEDDVQIRRFLKVTLEENGFKYVEADTAKKGLVQCETQMPDLIVLDLGLPDMDGLEVIERVREWTKVPIVVLSARGQEKDKVAALDAGADDYLTKPFGVEELMARLRVALRHSARTESSDAETVFRHKGLEVDLERRVVTVSGKEVHLTPIEYRLLTTLVKHAGKVLTGKELDPDFVAFNSQNQRYSFKRRSYISFRGLFNQIDPIAFSPGYRTGVYAYVRSRPLLLVDPAGADAMPAAGGVFGWLFQEPPKGADFQVLFIFAPTKGCCCKDILFLQTVLASTLGGKPFFPGKRTATGGADDDYYKKLAANEGKGAYIDHVKGAEAPYINAKWEKTLGSWVAKSANSKVGHCVPNLVNAELVDSPSIESARQGLGDVLVHFETCAFCADTAEILGCEQWGFEIEDKAGSKAKQWKGTKGDFSLSASDEFKSAAATWNQEAQNSKLTSIPGPTGATPNMGGTPPLPNK